MHDRQLERYSRHILMPEIDLAGQEQLLNSKVMIVGLGGIGSPAAMYLAASGIGHLMLNDHDHVDLGNLQRQILHSTIELNMLKTESARERLHSLNPDVHIDTIERQLTLNELAEYASHVDVVIDASDNFNCRYTINNACVMTQTPLVWGAATGLKGQVTVFKTFEQNPCLNCLYPLQVDQEQMGSCGESGVLAPLTGIIGSMMATEALKLLLGLGTSLSGRLLQFDAAKPEWRQSRFTKDPKCGICGLSKHQITRTDHAEAF
ncbi:MAG: ThiF family adenylyltransferase [Nitrospiraceae bacterium]